MKKRGVRILLALALICAMMPVFGLTAFAAGDYLSVTLQKGDTVYSLCQANGLDYYAEKNAIMVLNGMDRESQLSQLRAGDVIKLPTAKTVTATRNVISTEDWVEYYVVPYVIEKGDTIAHVYWLWGLRFENYVDDIKSLNGVDDLDLLYVGAIYLLPTTESNLQTDVYTTVMGHVMQPGETVYDVVASYGIDYNQYIPKFRSYNHGADLTKIQAGETLLIPLV